MTKTEARQALEREITKQLRDRILLELDMTNALRPSELFAFRWKRFDYQASTLTVAETVYKGSIRDWGKTKKSLAVIHIPEDLADDLETWRLECQERAQQAAAKDKTQSAFCARTTSSSLTKLEASSTPTNFRKRVLHKLARPQFAEADLPGHPPNHRDPGPEERNGKGCSGCHAALTYRYHHRRLHAGDTGKRAVYDQFDQS